jgi:multiple sugar transport system substrate-binding protein
LGRVVSKYSKWPEATYFLFAMIATKEKSKAGAVLGWGGIDPGWVFHFLPTDDTGDVQTYLQAGWSEADVQPCLHAYYENLSEPLQFPYLRNPGAFDFDEIAIRLKRDKQLRTYRASLGSTQ